MCPSLCHVQRHYPSSLPENGVPNVGINPLDAFGWEPSTASIADQIRCHDGRPLLGEKQTFSEATAKLSA